MQDIAFAVDCSFALFPTHSGPMYHFTS